MGSMAYANIDGLILTDCIMAMCRREPGYKRLVTSARI